MVQLSEHGRQAGVVWDPDGVRLTDSSYSMGYLVTAPDGTGGVVAAWADKVPSDRAATVIKCTSPGKKIMVERSMYWNNRGAGTC